MAIGQNLDYPEKPNRDTKTKISNGQAEILDQCLDAVVTMNEDKTIQFYNSAAQKFFGYTTDEVVGQNAKMIVPAEHLVNQDSFIGKSRELEMTRKDGSKFWGNISLSKIGTNGSTQYTAFIKDITQDRKDKIDAQSIRDAVNGGWASIEFNPDGTIIGANDNFVKTLGYGSESEIRGQHHRMFCDPDYARSAEYQNFWKDMANGRVQSGEFKRFTKQGEEVWINASYTPIKDDTGKVFKVVKIAANITAMITARVQANAVKSAVDTGWACIEFTPDGTVLDANDNFVKTLGYNTVNDIKGQHHRMFCDPDYVRSSDYQNFWRNLGNGNVQSGEFKRITRRGDEVWINASYTPVKDDTGKVFKVIKIATDITGMINSRIQANAVKSAVDTGWASIEFSPDGTIIDANDNFVKTLGYNTVNDIKGQHHRIFCDPDYAKSNDYQNFWRELGSGKVQAGEFKRFTRQGDELWINASYTPVKNDDGVVFKVIKIATDITDIKLPVLRVKDIITEIAQGNLTEEFDMDASGYVQEMGEALNEAIGNLNGLLSNISDVTVRVSDSSSVTLNKTENMLKTTQEVASAIQQMAEGAQQQAVQTDEVSKLIEQVSRSADDMGEKASIINKAAEEGKLRANNGLETLRMVVSSMNEIQSSAETTSNSIEILTKRSEEIARTLNVITDIASQTNLLALNAAIEAARAGDAGRGFAVVAEEIRKLAEDSRKSTVDIERVIKEVQKDISGAEKSINSMVKSVAAGSEASGKAETVFQEIENSSAETLSLSKEILSASTAQKGSIETTVKNIEQIVVVTEESASGSEQIATSSKELGNGMIDVKDLSSNLSAMVGDLNSQLTKFTLKK